MASSTQLLGLLCSILGEWLTLHQIGPKGLKSSDAHYNNGKNSWPQLELTACWMTGFTSCNLPLDLSAISSPLYRVVLCLGKGLCCCLPDTGWNVLQLLTMTWAQPLGHQQCIFFDSSRGRWRKWSPTSRNDKTSIHGKVPKYVEESMPQISALCLGL